jgi:pyruvate dehydrogenase E1 component
VLFQGHSSPGIYAAAFLEGRFTEEQMLRFRTEALEPGLSSYPHPWLMPEFWQFPTVSMGLGPLMAIYQARFMKYLTGRGHQRHERAARVGVHGRRRDGRARVDGRDRLAGREHLDNLVFVINCNLQRLDGPVRGNGKIIQELETNFRGAGWNVVKVIWGNRWDPLLEADHDGRLVKRMEEAVDGDYQTFKSRDGAYVREHFFGKDPELAKMVEEWSTPDIWTLNRGGHDPRRSTPRTPRRRRTRASRR